MMQEGVILHDVGGTVWHGGRDGVAWGEADLEKLSARTHRGQASCGKKRHREMSEVKVR